MSRRGIIPAVTLLLLFGLVAALALSGATDAVDHRLLESLRQSGHHGVAIGRGWLVTGAVALTWAGAGVVRAIVALAGASVLAGIGHVRRGAALLCGWAGEGVLVELVKPLAGRARPDLAFRLVHVSEASFPSGHAAGAMLLYPLLGLAIGGMAGRRCAVAATVAGILLALLIGATRVLLGVHWASDVVGGWTLGGAVACLAAAMMSGDARGAVKPTH